MPLAAAFSPVPGDALSGLWPQPTSASASGPETCLVNSNKWAFSLQSKVGTEGTARLNRAFARTLTKVYGPGVLRQQQESARAASSGWAHPASASDKQGREVATTQALQALHVYVASEDCTLNVSTNESYTLDLLRTASGGPATASLRAHTIYGVLHGLETFAQLTTRHFPACPEHGVGINSSSVSIRDAPRFRWRGLMVDTARHFLPVRLLERVLDAMEWNKLNVLHWHISDSQAFPLRTNRTAALAERGAYSAALTYSAEDVRRLVAYAQDRGVRIVPELDSPGHALSWAYGYPAAALPACQTVDPTAEATYALLETLLAEVAVLFPDPHLHIGADEVDFACWNRSDAVAEYMRQHGLPRTDTGFKGLTASYIARLTQIAARLGRSAVAWQEAMDHYGPTAANPTPPSPLLPPDLIVEQWLQPEWNYANLSAITGVGYLGRSDAAWPAGFGGFQSLVTLGWYLDSTEVNSWTDVYAREPLTNKSCSYDAASGAELACECKCPSGPWRDGACHCYDLRDGPEEQAAKVLGGEAPLWGEHIDASNLLPRAFPRASAVAERLWSAMERNNATAAMPRLLKHRCRMVARGVPVTPLGPGFCGEPASY